MTATYRHLPCRDCGRETDGRSGRKEYYMVKSWVWRRTGLGYYGGALCIGCLEARLGRRLRPQDFNRVTFGWMGEHSARLRSRLTGSPCRVEKTSKNSAVDSNGYNPPQTAKSIRSPRARWGTGKGIQVPAGLGETILRAEVGEVSVVRNLRDLPPRRLLAELRRGGGRE
jgi:hypothetical protein